MPDIDFGQLSEALNDKTDRDMNNLTAAGKEVCANLAMPSDRYIGLTLGASGATYTAPANGWLCLLWIGTNNDGYCTMSFNGTIASDVHEATNNYASNFIPLKKGESAVIYYRNLTVRGFYFVYAEGANNV